MPLACLRPLRRARDFARSRRGASIILVALCMIPLIGFVGLATDAARGYMAKARLSAAVDAAGLAAGRETTLATQQATAAVYFAANFPPNFMDTGTVTPALSVDDTNALIVTASATLPTTFMRILGIPNMTVGARSVVRRSAQGLEVVLVLDNTGSMRSGGKMEAMKTGAIDLVNILYGSRNTIPNPAESPLPYLLYVGVVPYTASVNIGNTRTDWLVPSCTLPHGLVIWDTEQGMVQGQAVANESHSPVNVNGRLTGGDRVIDPETGYPWEASGATALAAAAPGTTFKQYRDANPGRWTLVTWKNGFSYAPGYRVVDTAVTPYTIWEATAAIAGHPSAASGTFAQDRAAHPTYWTQVTQTCMPIQPHTFNAAHTSEYRYDSTHTYQYYLDPAHSYFTGGLAANAYTFTETQTTILATESPPGSNNYVATSGPLTFTETMPTGWKGCVEERDGAGGVAGNAVTDAPPSVERFVPYYYPDASDNDWIVPSNLAVQPQGVSFSLNQTNIAQDANGRGPNLGCGSAVTPMTPYKATVMNAISQELPWHRGGTATDIGLVWGWRMISPRWRGLWGGEMPSTMPLDYNTPNMTKVIVIETDGENQFYDYNPHNPGSVGPEASDYTGHGRIGWGRLNGATTISAGLTQMNNRMTQVCNALKAENVVIYTILFQTTAQAAINLFRNCATDTDHYFYAPDNDTLRSAFQQIGSELSNLRIAE